MQIDTGEILVSKGIIYKKSNAELFLKQVLRYCTDDKPITGRPFMQWYVSIEQPAGV